MDAFPGEGEWLDGYRIDERLHSGGMGQIYRVTAEVDPGFPLIMKVPRLGYGEPGETITSYEQEQMVMSVLQGPHAPRYVGAGDLAKQPYLVLEFVEGFLLADWVEKAPLPPEEVARLGCGPRQRPARPPPAGGDPPRREAVQRDHPARWRGGAHRLRPRQPRPLPGPARRGAAPADGLGALHLAGAGPGRPLRPAQRHLLAGRRALRAGHRRVPLRLSDLAVRAAPPPPRGAGPAARHRTRPSPSGSRR